jgi:glycolate oxidase FAD binding subunit
MSRVQAGLVAERTGWLLGPEAVEDGGGVGPVVARPASSEQVQAVIRVAVEEGWRIRPVGARVGLDLWPGGGRTDRIPPPPTEPHLLLATDALDGVLSYEPADLTVEVGAGTTLGALDGRLAEHGQWLPLDPPGGDRVTVGGAVAAGVAGPLHTAFGRPRDLVLGLAVIDGRGRELALGGRVVKNVAGFDLVRLTCGSRGALGMIHRVAFRLFPRPPEDRTLVWEFATMEEAGGMATKLASSPFVTPDVELHGGGPERGDVVQVGLRLVDRPPVVRRIARWARTAAGEPTREWEGADSRAAAVERAEIRAAGSPLLTLRAAPADLLRLLGSLEDAGLGPGADLCFSGGARSGALQVSGPGLAEDFVSLVPRLAGVARELNGSLRVLRGPEGWSPGAGPAEAFPPAVEALARLHGRLRRSFDPHGVLPGAWREGWR